MRRLRTAGRRGLGRANWLLAIFCGAVACGSAALAAGPLRLSVDAATVTVTSEERPILVYHYVQNPAKPYIEKLFSPNGVNVLRDSPADHKHHHGLMFAVAVDGVDFWSENPKCGRQVHRGGQRPEVTDRHGSSWASGAQEIDWVAPGGEKLLLRETRRIAVGGLPEAKATLVTWQCRLDPPGKKSVTLSGSTYFGLGMRFVVSMDQGGRFVNADGKTGVAGTNAARSAWCAYSASADGKPVTVAMFDDPKNPRHPATWFTLEKPFAYMSATLDLSRQPLVIEAGKPLELRYAAAVWDGPVDAAKIAAVSREAFAPR